MCVLFVVLCLCLGLYVSVFCSVCWAVGGWVLLLLFLVMVGSLFSLVSFFCAAFVDVGLVVSVWCSLACLVLPCFAFAGAVL